MFQAFNTTCIVQVVIVPMAVIGVPAGVNLSILGKENRKISPTGDIAAFWKGNELRIHRRLRRAYAQLPVVIISKACDRSIIKQDQSMRYTNGDFLND